MITGIACRFSALAEVRFGSLADTEPHPADVRFTPESGHSVAR
jgi:hypothetical protein